MPDFKIEIRQTLEALFATFQVEASTDLLRGYLFGLSDLSLDELRCAVARAIRESTRLPLPAELRAFAGASSDTEATAIQAWGIVLRAVTTHGPYKSVDFEDRLCNAVVRNLGGWPTFIARFTDAEAEKWVRLEFIRAYQAFAASNVDGEVCLALPGLAQSESVRGVVQDCQPRRIACPTANRVGIENRKPIGSGLLELKKA